MCVPRYRNRPNLSQADTQLDGFQAYGEFAYSRLIADYVYQIQPQGGGSQVVSPREVPPFGCFAGAYTYRGRPLGGDPARIGNTRGSIMDYGGGLQAHLSGHRLQPYGLAGIGAVRTSAKVTIPPALAWISTYDLAGSFGGGVRLFATRNVGFSLEVKTVRFEDGGRFERYALGMFFQRRRPGW